MRISISNIAWDVTEDEAVTALLRRYHVNAIDIAPSKYFPNPELASASAIADVRNVWAERGIEITGMQALLFGTSGLNLFGDTATQATMLKHLQTICRIASGLGAPRLVFGSPKNRDRSALSDSEALALAVDFFRRLGDIAQEHGVFVCLEPNPSCYGCNFMTNTSETAEIVSAVAHPAIRMQLDTGAMTINAEAAETTIANHFQLFGHVHLSEPDLLPLGEGGSDHSRLAALVRHYLPHHIATIEMLASKNEPHLATIERALRVAVEHYQ